MMKNRLQIEVGSEGDMRILVILTLALLSLALLICYSALVVVSRADEWEREEWEAKGE